MQQDNRLQQAISAARAGRELTARDMFLDIVRDQPQNELAWMWLAGLLDDLDECIHACERTLVINPNNQHARQYLGQLMERRRKETEIERASAEQQAREVREAIKLQNPEASLERIRELTGQKYVSADAWRLLAELSPDIEERIHALENLSQLAPDDNQVKTELGQLKHFQEDPLDLAAYYEEQGDLDQAIMTYSLASQNPRFKKQWNQIYWKIIRLENLKQEKIAHVRPAVSIARLTFGPPLLYFILLLLQVGINPFMHPEPVLYLGFPWVVLGSFMIALASVRSHHRLWSILFRHPAARATPASRLTMMVSGWILVLLPYLILLLSAVFRLLNSLVN